MSRRASILSKVLQRGADAFADRLQVPPENREAFRLTFESVMIDAFRIDRVGEKLPTWGLYVAKTTDQERQQRQRRILQALASNEAPASIAKREQVSVRWVRVLRAKAGGQGVAAGGGNQ
jgi:hypothetical protein